MKAAYDMRNPQDKNKEKKNTKIWFSNGDFELREREKNDKTPWNQIQKTNLENLPTQTPKTYFTNNITKPINTQQQNETTNTETNPTQKNQHREDKNGKENHDIRTRPKENNHNTQNQTQQNQDNPNQENLNSGIPLEHTEISNRWNALANEKEA